MIVLEFKIQGILITDEMTHEEMLELLYEILQKNNMFFKGVTERTGK